MPRHPRPLPVRINRFNYWQYECTNPSTDPSIPSAGWLAHRDILKTFRDVRDGIDTPSAQWHRPWAAAELGHIGIHNPTPALLALAYYLSIDRLWSQNPEVWMLLKQQPAETQDALCAWAHCVWRRRTPRCWDTLLRTIARDQALFHDLLARGPTKAGLVATRCLDISPIWEKYGVSEAAAQRVYRTYHRKMSELLGRGVIVSEKVRNMYRDHGIEAPRVRPTRPLEELAALPADEHIPTIIHWFAHTLRNLSRYRDGHSPIPWHPRACRQRCLQVQRRLMA
jgi:hypothetical protein